jgi:hypothetical protein
MEDGRDPFDNYGAIDAVIGHESFRTMRPGRPS